MQTEINFFFLLLQLSSAVKEKVSVVQAKGIERDVGPLLPFEELLDADSNLDSGKQEDNSRSNPLEVCTLPDPQALLHVTSRRKVASRKKSSSLVHTLLCYFNFLSK